MSTLIDWKLPLLETSRVKLREVSEDDVPALYRIFSHPDVMRYWGAPPLDDLEGAKAMVREIQEGIRNQQVLKWGIARLADNALIGTVTLFNLNLENGRAEIGYGLDRECWGKGYMSESLNAVLDFAFNVLDLRRLEADVDPRNINSIRTVERLGFQQEGYLRERWHVSGEIQDALFFGLLKREWEAQRAKGNNK